MKTIIDSIILWLKNNKTLVISFSIFSLVLLILSIIAIPYFIVALPPDYFKKKKAKSKPAWLPSYLYLIYLVLKNILGIVLMILGLIMLLLPGQGLITLLLGILLVDLPGERKLLLFILRKTPALRAMNWLRKKNKKQPFQLP